MELMRRKNHVGWNTKFGTFVGRIGPIPLAQQIGSHFRITLHHQTVYNWVWGERSPSREFVLELERISKGEVTASEILGHRDRVVRLKSGSRG